MVRIVLVDVNPPFPVLEGNLEDGPGGTKFVLNLHFTTDPVGTDPDVFLSTDVVTDHPVGDRRVLRCFYGVDDPNSGCFRG